MASIIQDYDDLQTQIAKYLKRQDLTVLIPNFIMFAEDYFDKTVYVTARRTSFKGVPTQAVFDSPSDMKQPIQAYIGGRILDFFPIGWESQYAGGNVPKIANGYQIIGDKISLSVPQLGEVFQLDYYQTLEPLSENNQSNWLLEDSPSIYLAGALHEAFSYIRDIDRSTYWLQKRDAAIETYINDDLSSRHPSAQLTIRAG